MGFVGKGNFHVQSFLSVTETDSLGMERFCENRHHGVAKRLRRSVMYPCYFGAWCTVGSGVRGLSVAQERDPPVGGYGLFGHYASIILTPRAEGGAGTLPHSPHQIVPQRNPTLRLDWRGYITPESYQIVS